MTTHEKVSWAEQQQSRNRMKRDFIDKRAQEDRVYRSVAFSDPKWNKEWYLVRTQLIHFSENEFFFYRKIRD